MNDREDFFSGMYDHGDLESFKEHLTFEEMHRFEKEERVIKSVHADLLKKYALIVADRLSRKSLVEALQNYFDFSAPGFIKLIDSMDNESLQKLLSMLKCAWIER